MLPTIFSILNSILGDPAFSRILMIGIEWYLDKKKTDQESRELLVSLAMSLRKQGVADVVMSFRSENDAEQASREWDKIEGEKSKGTQNEQSN